MVLDLNHCHDGAWWHSLYSVCNDIFYYYFSTFDSIYVGSFRLLHQFGGGFAFRFM
jgi:hypothetical protein